MYKIAPAILLVVLLLFSVLNFLKNNATSVVNFDECAKAGNPIMESYPRQCRDAQGNLFVEAIGNELKKHDLIKISSPRPGEIIASPLRITGQARGFWFFEATFPIVLVDWDGKIIAESFATADGNWMTEEFVPFTAELQFQNPSWDASAPQSAGASFSKRGALILKKDNPSGFPENDDALEIPVLFE